MKFDRLQLKDFVTLSSAGFGFLAVYFARTEYVLAAIFVVLAAVLDYLDGRVAKASGASNAFGRELDSLSDAVSFGVAPALASLAIAPKNLEMVQVGAALVFVWAALVRLARFNLYAGQGKYYGLPAPAAAVILVVLAPVFGVFSFLLLLALSGLMLAGFEMKKPAL